MINNLNIQLKKVSFVILILFLTIKFDEVRTQQDPQVSLNKYNILPINPGFAGANGSLCASILYRNQWMGFEGAPKTMILSVDYFLSSFNSGIGLNIYNDALGFEKNTYFNLNFAYHVNVGEGTLGLGLALGAINKSIDGDWITPDKLLGLQPNPYSDPAIPRSESKLIFDSNFGIFYRSGDDKLYGGISTTHLTQPEVKFSLSKTPYIRRHYYVNVGSYIELPDKNWGVIPSAFIKYDGSTAQYDINFLIEYRRQFRGGLTYRFGDAIVFIIGYTTPSNITFALAYDLTTSNLRTYQKGSIEAFIKTCFSIETEKTRGKYGSVRFL